MVLSSINMLPTGPNFMLRLRGRVPLLSENIHTSRMSLVVADDMLPYFRCRWSFAAHDNGRVEGTTGSLLSASHSI